MHRLTLRAVGLGGALAVVAAIVLTAVSLWGSGPSANAVGGPATPTNTPGPAPTAKPPSATGALTGVSDIVVDGGNPTLDAYHCISYTQHRADDTLKVAAMCFDNAGALSDAAAEPLNDAPGEGPDGATGLGPPPPPPYSPAAPAKGTGALSGGNLDVWTCFPELGGSSAPNIVARLEITGAVTQLNTTGKQTATTNIYLAQSDAVCAQAQSGATPTVTGSPITLGATVYPATDNANCPASNCVQASWRNGGAPSAGGDFDGDGCTDQAELDKLDTSKCGDDPWNPNDSILGTDVAGDYSIIATVVDEDTGIPGFYYPCGAVIEQSGKNIKAWVNCYIDSPGIVINPQAAKDNSNSFSNPTSCGVGATQAPVDYCGDGSPGSPPPGVTAGAANIHNFADIDDKSNVLTGTVDNTKNIIILNGCFEDRDGHSPLGNVYARATVDLHTGHGFVEIHSGQTTVNCTGGTPTGAGGDAQLSLVRQRKGTLPMRDADSDGCGDRRELGDPGNLTSADTFQGKGGLRDPGNHYDYMNPSMDGLNRVDDILATVNEYFNDDPPGKANIDFKSRTDRTALGGGNAWNLGPPNGQQRVDDILAGVKQYFHDCNTTAYDGGGGPPPDTPTPTRTHTPTGPPPTPTHTPTDTPTPTSTPTGGGTPAVFGELGTSGNEVAILPGTTVTWTCDPGNPTTDTAIRFDYNWGNEDVNDPGTGALSITQNPPVNVLNSVACVFDGNAGTSITVNWPPLVDPSGVVTDIPSGLPIPEAIVTLQVESPPDSGIYVNVPVESDPNPPDPGPYGIKEPDFNPETTGPNGEYGWDVVAGRYRVVVSKATCSTVTSAPVLIVSDPVTDLNVGITCQDNNSNNIPDVIESLYGFNDPAGDADGDGLTNQEELTLGLTNPLVRDDVDRDGDGCVNLKKVGPGQYRGELTSSELSGGLRDDSNPWDYFDPDKGPQSVGIQRIGDILVVLYNYYVDVGDPGYDTSTDRAANIVGPGDWNLGPPDGLERIQDILHALNQYYNDCA